MADPKAPNCMRCGSTQFVEVPYRLAAGLTPYQLLCCGGCMGVVSAERNVKPMDGRLALLKGGFDPDAPDTLHKDPAEAKTRAERARRQA
jgi:hypothetical protein